MRKVLHYVKVTRSISLVYLSCWSISCPSNPLYAAQPHCHFFYPSQFLTFECLAMVVKSVPSTLLLTVYHLPKLKKVFLDEFAELLSKISIDYDCIVISGDFSIHTDNSIKSDTKLLMC